MTRPALADTRKLFPNAGYGARQGSGKSVIATITTSPASANGAPAARSGPGFAEFIALMALMTALMALSIDLMLPGLGEIGGDLGAGDENERQLVLTMLFLGLAGGQLLYGPLSDRYGRKPPLYVGLAIFVVGCVISMLAGDFTTMLIGRLLQGIGIAAPRVVSLALIRDRFAGDGMARVMSLILAVFILVPMVAPAIGQGILLIAHWRVIFAALMVLGVMLGIWFALRQPETLPPERRSPLSVRHIWHATVETCTNRTAAGYTIAAGLIFGAFLGYLNSVQQIFQEQYGLGVWFPAVFAALAVFIGAASVANARLVMRMGMRRLCYMALYVLAAISCVFTVVALSTSGHPPLWSMMVFLSVCLFCFGLLFGNFNAVAMEPLGHIAGIAAAVIASVTTFISLAGGLVIGQMYDGSVRPVVIGFAVLSLISIAVVKWTDKGRVPARSGRGLV